MENAETGTRFANPEEHAVILLAAVNGCAVEESIIGLDEAARGVVAIQEPAAVLGEGKEFSELPRGSQFEKCAALGIGDAVIGNLRGAIKISVRALKDNIGARALWTRILIRATSTGESEHLIDGSRALRVGGCRQRQTEYEDHDRGEAASFLTNIVL